jgi:hypothetical protein
MSDGFVDFGFGDGDKSLNRKTKKFDPEAGKTYLVSFVWYREYNADGTPNLSKNLRFTNCERIYKEGVGYFLYKGPAYAEFGKPKTAIATVIAVWPTDNKGNADMSRLQDVEVLPWIFSSDKYEILARVNEKFPLVKTDVQITCTDSKFKKITITPDNTSVMDALRKSEKPGAQALLKSIYGDVDAIANGIRRDLARDLSLDEIREKLGMDVASPTSSRVSKDADGLLDDLV